MNIWTGQKEAKINDPTENDPALEGLPVDRSVVVVEPEEPLAEQMPRGAPAYEEVGKIKKPIGESHSFYDALKLLKKGAKGNQVAFDEALASLEDISHDIYYGLKITEDADIVKSLFCLMTDRDGAVTSGGALPRDQQAAAILAGALQNNPTALKEISKSWDGLMDSSCRKKGAKLREGFYASFMPSEAISTAEIPRAAGRAKARVAAINGLIKSPEIRADFMANNGMALLLEVLIPAGEEWAPAQKKVGVLLLDNFLDADMGATTGIFPRRRPLSNAKCQSTESQTEEGCWQYQVERIAKGSERSHWSKDVHKRLRAAEKRIKHDDGRPEKEL
jgi:nucleotide exchange factor SIL1